MNVEINTTNRARTYKLNVLIKRYMEKVRPKKSV